MSLMIINNLMGFQIDLQMIGRACVWERTYFAHLLGNLFGHLAPISNEGANLFGRGSVQNERQTHSLVHRQYTAAPH